MLLAVAIGSNAMTTSTALSLPTTTLSASSITANAPSAPKPDERKAKQWFISSIIYSVASIIFALLSYPILASVFALLGLLSLFWGLYKRKN